MELTEIQMIVAVMFLLQLKHFVADFMLQTDQMVMEKGTYGARFGIYHSAIQAFGTFLALAWIHPFLGVVTAVFDFLVHYHVDWAKMNITKFTKWGPTTHPEFWWLTGFDQFLHQVTYILLIALFYI